MGEALSIALFKITYAKPALSAAKLEFPPPSLPMICLVIYEHRYRPIPRLVFPVLFGYRPLALFEPTLGLGVG